MKGKKYERPLMRVEQFTPNEYVAECWYVPSCYNNLYYDKTKNVWGNYGTHNNDDENVVENHGAHRLPENENTYFKTEEYPFPSSTNLLPHQYTYYTSYTESSIMGIPYRPYSGEISSNTDIYKYTIDKVDHYFSSPQKKGNHS